MTWLRKSLSALGVAGLTGLFASGCQKNESMLFIMGVLAIDRTDCVAQPESGATVLVSGVMDRAILGNGGYEASVFVGSNLTQRGSREQLRTETNMVILRGAEVTLEDPTGQRLSLTNGAPNPYSTIGTGNVPPASGTSAGFGSTSVTIVPPGLNLPDGVIVSRVRVFGDTLGGTEIESNEFVFPIEVCTGCLIAYPASAFDETQSPTARYLCERRSTDTSAQDTACRPGQDSRIVCSTCSAGNPACRDPCLNCSIRAQLEECAADPTVPAITCP